MITNADVRSSRVAGSRIRRSIQGMTLGALLTQVIATPALAGEWVASAKSTNDPFAAFPIINHDQMAQLRGGFDIAGLKFGLGANVRILIDNVVRLETIVQLTQAGWVSANMNPAQAAGSIGGSQLSQVAQNTADLVKNIATGAVNGSQPSPANSAAIATAGNTQAAAASRGQGGIVSIDLAGQLAGLRNLATQARAETTSANSSAASGGAPGPLIGPGIIRLGSGAQVDLSGLGNKIQEVVLNDTKGLTTAIQEFTNNRISSTVINQANGRRIDVQMNVQLDVKNFSQYSAALRNTLLNSRLLSNQNNF